MARIYRFLGKFGSSGSGDGQFDNPQGIAVDDNYIYIVDNSNNRIQVFDHSFDYVTQFGSAGTGDGQFKGLVTLEVNDNYIYTLETGSWSGNDRVQIFDKNAAYAFEDKFSIVNTSPRYGLAITETRIYIGCTESANIVREYDIDTHLLVNVYNYDASAGQGAGSLRYKEGVLYSCSWEGLRKIQKHVISGGITTFVSGSFLSVDVDNNYLYALLQTTNRVNVYDISTGSFVGYFGSSGSQNGEFSLVATPDSSSLEGYSSWIRVYNNKIYVVDTLNSRVQIFDFTDLTTPDTPSNFALQCASGDRIRLSWE